jgi:parallel beta-helix repeat protein
MYDSSYNIISENYFYKNQKGLLLDRWSDNNIIYNNNITSKCFGISLYISFNNYIFNNDIFNCTRGAYITYSKYNNITNNNFIMNRECGICITSSNDNIISSNSFLDNNQDIKQGPEPPKIKAPSFEILLVFLAILLILILKKKQKKY